MLAMPTARQPNFSALLDQPTAARGDQCGIVLARLGEQVAQEIDRNGPRSIAQAALAPRGRRGLGACREAVSPAVAAELTDQYGNFLGQVCREYIPELHAELLYAWAGKRTPPDDPRFTAAVASQRSKSAWRPWNSWARGATEGCRRKSPICAATPRSAGVRRLWPPWLPARILRALEYAHRGLLDTSLDVKLAAIAV